MKNVVIIGAGPAGLTAALQISKNKDFEIIVLEETNEIGGISRTVRYGGNRMDIGGHRFFSKSKEVTDFWEAVMPLQGAPALDDALLLREKPLSEGGPDPSKEDRVMLVRDRVSRIFYLNKFFDYPISMKPQTFKNMGFARTMKSGFSYLYSAVFKRKEDSLENFYINRFGRTLYSMFFEGYTEKLWGRHPRDISADWGAQRVKGLSIIAVVKDMFAKLFHTKGKNVETSLIEQFSYPKFGPGQLWEAVAADAKKNGVEIKMNCRVDEITVKDGNITELSVIENGTIKKIKGDIFISSMPIKDLVAGINGETPSERVRELALGLPYRDFVTVGLLVNKLNLKNETNRKTLGNIVPDCWIYVQDSSVKLGRIQIFNNWSPYMVKDPINTVWIGLEYFCSEGDEFWSMSDANCVKFAASELKKMGVIDESDSILDSHHERVKKAYPAYFDTYDNIDEIIAYLNSIDNLYCVGRNGQHRYNNMDHSMLTAMRAADCIIHGGDKTDIWNVNTEKEYHEEGKEN